MPKLTGEPVQVRVKGITAAKLFDARFVGLLEKEFPGIKYGPIHFYLYENEESKRFESIMMGFFDPEHEKKQLFTIDCDEPETMKKLLHLFEAFLEAAHG